VQERAHGASIEHSSMPNTISTGSAANQAR
jgi:hypothetical protein